MIELNLLPEELKKKKRQIVLPEIPFIPITAGVIAVIVITQLFVSGLIFLKERELRFLDAAWQKLAPQNSELEKIKTAITTANKTNQAIENLMRERLSWSKLLNSLSNDLTTNIWLTDLSYNETQKNKGEANGGTVRILTLSGTATGAGEEPTTHVARFIKALKSDKDFFDKFDDIELVSIKKNVVAGQDVMNFTLTCRFKEKLKAS